ncbi:MAG: hypothetical protein JWM53_2728 [bacterium]|nr:hypothetical protein [bacterium]
MNGDLRSAVDDVDQALAKLRTKLTGPTGELPAVSPHITRVAWSLISEMLHKRCPEWRATQLFHEATTAIGMTGNKALLADLKAAICSRGKIEYEVEAVEDVLIKHFRARTCS